MTTIDHGPSNDRLKGSASSRVAISSTAWDTESLSSSHWARTDVVTIAISPATSASPASNAIAAADARAAGSEVGQRSVEGGAIVSATMIGRTITWRYQSSAITAASAAPTARSRHDQSAAFARFGGTGGVHRRIGAAAARSPVEATGSAARPLNSSGLRLVQRTNVVSPGTRPCARRGAPQVQASAFA